MESLGEYLKKERELKMVTIEEIAHITRISTRFLYALEKNDYESLPANVFVKGFLRAYAKCVGLNADEVISIYERTKKDKERVEVKEDKGSEKHKIQSLKLIMIISVAVVLIAAGGGIYYMYRPQKDITVEAIKKEVILSQAETPSFSPSSDEIPVKSVADGASSIPVNESDKNKSVEDKKEGVRNIETNGREPKIEASQPKILEPLSLVITATERAWLQIIVDETETREFILTPGERFALKSKERFLLTTGNIKGTEVTLDGVRVTLPDNKSNVLRNY